MARVGAFALLLLGGILVGCTTADGNGEPTLDELLGTSWRVETLAGRPAAEGVESTLSFAEPGRVQGLGGCNRYAGPLRVEDGRLRVGPLVATRMACPPPRMEQEQLFLDLLERGRRFRREGATLLLESDGEAEPSRFRRLDGAEG